MQTLSRISSNGGQSSATKVVTCQYLARAIHYPPWRRACDAARWIHGEIQVAPTLKLAAKTFGVSVPLVAEANKRLERARLEEGKRHGNGGTATLSDDAVARIVEEVGVDRIWRAVDKLTSPEMPLQAAE